MSAPLFRDQAVKAYMDPDARGGLVRATPPSLARLFAVLTLLFVGAVVASIVVRVKVTARGRGGALALAHGGAARVANGETKRRAEGRFSRLRTRATDARTVLHFDHTEEQPSPVRTARGPHTDATEGPAPRTFFAAPA